jgi:hypothetical protein
VEVCHTAILYYVINVCNVVIACIIYITGIRAHWIYAGISNVNGKKQFLRSNKQSELEHNEWGLHSINPAAIAKQNEEQDKGAQYVMEEFDVIRLVDIFRNHIQNRNIPGNSTAADPPPAVVMKIDVEGEEYAVLRDLLKATEKPLCYVAGLSVEFHMPIKREQKPIQTPTSNKRSQAMIDQLQRYRHDTGCEYDVILYDTEAYFNDNIMGNAALEQWCRLQQLNKNPPSRTTTTSIPEGCEHYYYSKSKAAKKAARHSSTSLSRLHSHSSSGTLRTRGQK